jgi:hypothetical protein
MTQPATTDQIQERDDNSPTGPARRPHYRHRRQAATTVQDVPFSINAQTQEDISGPMHSTVEISRNVAGLAVQISAGPEPGFMSAASPPARSSATSRE